MLTLEDIWSLEPGTPNSLITINDFVSGLIPIFHSSPYRIKEGDTVESLYNRFLRREIGGWCGLFTAFSVMLLKQKGFSAYPYNYGIIGTEFTHVVVIASGFLIDPYFNKYYADDGGGILTLEDLKSRVKDRNFRVVYGSSVMTKRIDKEVGHKFISLTGKEWEDSLMESWSKKSFEKILTNKFGEPNPNLMLLRKL